MHPWKIQDPLTVSTQQLMWDREESLFTGEASTLGLAPGAAWPREIVILNPRTGRSRRHLRVKLHIDSGGSWGDWVCRESGTRLRIWNT